MGKINVLWTGGLDSSFRVLEIVATTTQDVCVQPHYILDKDRKSFNKELEAINRITMLVNKKNGSERILSVIVVDKDKIAVSPDIMGAFKSLNAKYRIGSQYTWLSQYAHDKGIMLEVGLEGSPRSKAWTAITKEGRFIETKSDLQNVGGYLIDNEHSTKDLIQIFGHFTFPKSLWYMSKLEEVERLNQLGYGDFVKETWFCHSPVFGFPCGHCNPCKDALNEGLAWRVPMLGRVMGTMRTPFNLCGKTIRHILQKFCKN